MSSFFEDFIRAACKNLSAHTEQSRVGAFLFCPSLCVRCLSRWRVLVR
nr:MAG TPA: hypothetical protein [Caudoviricetes sp.]